MSWDLLASRQEPPAHAENCNEACHANGVVHVRRCNRPNRGEEQDDTDEADPNDGDIIDWLAPAAEGVWAFDELDSVLVDSVRGNNGDVAEVESRGSDVENADNSLSAAHSYKIHTAAESNHKPDGIDRCSSDAVDLAPESALCQFPSSQEVEPVLDMTYPEKGKASSRANAYAIRAFASIAEQPVKNCTRITKNHIIVPPTGPPAFRKTCAIGIPVGDFMIASKSLMQKQNVIVSIHPTRPDTRMAMRMASGPRIAAS